MEIILKEEKIVPFEFENLKGEFVCRNPKASEVVAFWAKFQAVEGTPEEKATKRTDITISIFSKLINEVRFPNGTIFKEEKTGKLIDPKLAMLEYFSIVIYQVGLRFLNPHIGGTEKDPLELNSNAS